jgi:oligosaccharide repeat unit polymerase
MHIAYNRSLYSVCLLYAVVFLIAFGLLPVFFVSVTGLFESHAYTLSLISIFSTFFVFAGAFVHSDMKFKRIKLVLNFTYVSLFIFAIFICFVFVCLLTAERIPIVASIQGEDPSTLAFLREMFLKARTGWQSTFVYINALLGGAIVPYIICVAFERKSQFRYIFLLIFFLYSISFLEKAFFLKIAIPLFFLFYVRVKTKFTFILISAIATLGLLVFMSLAAGGPKGVIDSDSSFFSTGYTSTTPLEQVIWRALVIPVVTSIDAIRLFFENFNGIPLLGATNATLSFFFQRPRIEFEKEVFNLQWGQNEAGTGSANSVYLTEAYVNFGWIGVAIFAFLVGRILYIFLSSKEISIKAISFLFIYGIFNSGLLSNLLSNGYLVMLLIASHVSWKNE